MKSNTPHFSKLSLYLWVSLPVVFIGLLFARAALPTNLYLQAALLAALAAILVGLILSYRSQIRGRTVSYGANWAITILLTFSIVGVVNFFAHKNPKKFDVTRGKINTLSEQTTKILRETKLPIQLTYFARLEEREKNRPLFENIRAVNPQVNVENIDALKGALQAQALGIRAENTLIVKVGAQETRIEAPTEEKIANALIKVTQGKPPVVCSITNHGEKDFNSSQQDGFMIMKKTLEQQNYSLKDVNLISEGKIPAECASIVILGAKSALLDQEVKILRDYFTNGGRGLITLDLNIRGTDPSPQMVSLIREFGVDSTHALIVDPLSARNNLPLDIAPITNLNDHPITKDLKEIRQGYLSAATRPLKVLSPSPEGLKVEWLAQSTPSAFAKLDFAELAKGKVSLGGNDIKGPHTVAVAISGKAKGSTAKENTRLVVIGSTMFAANAFGELGKNIDFFANSVSWTLENENLISIRPKEEDSGKIELSETAGRLIGLITVIVVPLLVLIAGGIVWVVRRRL